MKAQMDRIVSSLPSDKIPWNRETPPEILVDLVENGKIQPTTGIDLGCGMGNYAIYLAGKGFTMTGVDISSSAIKQAKKNAKEKNVNVNFIQTDLTGNIKKIRCKFNFAYDWEVLHHIFPEQRLQYVANVNALLKFRILLSFDLL